MRGYGEIHSLQPDQMTPAEKCLKEASIASRMEHSTLRSPNTDSERK